MVISGGNFRPDQLKPKEVVSLLLDDAEIEKKCKFFTSSVDKSLQSCYTNIRPELLHMTSSKPDAHISFGQNIFSARDCLVLHCCFT